jgi:hypothetical protein
MFTTRVFFARGAAIATVSRRSLSSIAAATPRVAGSTSPAENVGIVALDAYFPSRYVSQSKLEEHDGQKPGKYTIGLGQERMAVAGAQEDINSMCLSALARLMEKHGLQAKVCPSTYVCMYVCMYVCRVCMNVCMFVHSMLCVKYMYVCVYVLHGCTLCFVRNVCMYVGLSLKFHYVVSQNNQLQSPRLTTLATHPPTCSLSLSLSLYRISDSSVSALRHSSTSPRVPRQF